VHAHAWLPPFPPEPTLNEFACKVSPPLGIRDVYVVRSALREPIIAMMGSEVDEVADMMLICAEVSRQGQRTKKRCFFPSVLHAPFVGLASRSSDRLLVLWGAKSAPRGPLASHRLVEWMSNIFRSLQIHLVRSSIRGRSSHDGKAGVENVLLKH
jgi:hypothetical protein